MHLDISDLETRFSYTGRTSSANIAQSIGLSKLFITKTHGTKRFYKKHNFIYW